MIFNETGVDPGAFPLVGQAGPVPRNLMREHSHPEDQESRRLGIPKTGNRGFRGDGTQPSRSRNRKATFMTRELVPHNRPVFDQLHPIVYKAAVGLVAWFALSAWILFDHQNDIGLPLAMVSVLLLIAVLLPWSLSLVWQKHQMARQRHPEKISFRDWKNDDFPVWGSKLRGMHAAIDMLLPLAAVAFGLTALGIVFLICANTAS